MYTRPVVPKSVRGAIGRVIRTVIGINNINFKLRR